MADASSSASTWDGLLSGLLQTGAGVYGSQNAAEQQQQGIQAGVNQENQAQTNINNLYGAQTTAGNGAFNALSGVLGLNGSAPDFSQFYNMPGYQFAVNQGTQAINRQAAAMGSAYTPNTLAAVGQYVTGTASQDYNNYVNQLLQTAGYGASANQSLTSANLNTAGNIAQLYQNKGNAGASGVAGVSGALAGGAGNLISGASSLPWGSILSGIGNMFGGGSNSTDTSSFNSSGVSGALDNMFSDQSLFGSDNGLSTDYSSLNPDLGSSNVTGNIDYSLTGNGSDNFNASGFGGDTGF